MIINIVKYFLRDHEDWSLFDLPSIFCEFVRGFLLKRLFKFHFVQKKSYFEGDLRSDFGTILVDKVDEQNEKEEGELEPHLLRGRTELYCRLLGCSLCTVREM